MRNRPCILFAVAAAALLAMGCEGSLGIADETGSFAPGTTGGTQGKDPGTTVEPVVLPEPSLHRLNRLEYNNSVRDLLGTSLRPADDFPPDASVGGFDNVARALSITPTLMNRYVDAARVVVDDAFAERPAFQATFEENDARLTYNINRDANSIGGIVRLRGGTIQTEVEVPAAGPHVVVVRAQGVQSGAVAAPRMRLSIAGQNFDFDVPLSPQDTAFQMELPAGRHAVALAALNFDENAAENRGNDILFDRFVVRSDALVPGPGRARIMICDPADATNPGCATTIVHEFAYRAWRRPLTDTERGELAALLAAVQTEGEGVEAAIKLVLRAILTSPKFLYRYRTLEDADSETLLDPYVLASRLSYFIWSSTPDDRLLSAAQDGTLSSLDGVRETVAWMLEDERAVALADGFAEQWLDLRHLAQASPSAEVYPAFNEALRQSMMAESRLFFLDYLERDTPLATMLLPDFAWRDATLATHLGVPAPAEPGFQRVAVTAGERRGVLSLTAWLTARSNAEHSSPIRRGAYVADNMLCAPVPPPPAGLDIGMLQSAESGLSVRERLALHRDDPTCASCHARLDPLGMGFEVYDGIGRTIDDPALDSQGELAGAGPFRGGEELAALIEPQAFVSCVSRKLFSYALGRTATAGDFEEVDAFDDTMIVSLTLPDLVTAIATSPAFSEPRPLE